jgi:Tfp pilus assembly protein FimT
MKQPRRATTLFELIVVLAILAVVAALAVPSLQMMQGAYRLNGAIDSVKGGWAEARANAIAEGRSYRFAVQADGGGFRVAPDQDEYWSGNGAAPADDPNGQGKILEKSLPKGVRFSVQGEGSSGGSASEAQHKDGDDSAPAGGNWSPVVVFRADGTASEDVRIRFQVSGARTTTLQLTGLTGDVAVEKE